eukprot:CAMPEP_0179053148 /NCGR_PEP_ID=MMETSP0796-20121207/22120_1 /TAXON_ID=73915 /ORGANISM="Pyrodinium bahamense, Strain pbaha01" /LENGTH=89 /DNA_ID=CAMNT_0020749729 /DNA_START=987 /DNA_END=1253 /DNA_ORIENTATION=-
MSEGARLGRQATGTVDPIPAQRRLRKIRRSSELPLAVSETASCTLDATFAVEPAQLSLVELRAEDGTGTAACPGGVSASVTHVASTGCR